MDLDPRLTQRDAESWVCGGRGDDKTESISASLGIENLEAGQSFAAPGSLSACWAEEISRPHASASLIASASSINSSQ